MLKERKSLSGIPELAQELDDEEDDDEEEDDDVKDDEKRELDRSGTTEGGEIEEPKCFL